MADDDSDHDLSDVELEIVSAYVCPYVSNISKHTI